MLPDYTLQKYQTCTLFYSATCLKAQEDFNLSTCTDDTAIALTLCCSATTRLSSVLEDPPVEWDDQILHQLRFV